MFIKPQIVSTPHMVTRTASHLGGACQTNYNAGGVTCASDFKCSPYQGKCVDATYIGGSISAIIDVAFNI